MLRVLLGVAPLLLLFAVRTPLSSPRQDGAAERAAAFCTQLGLAPGTDRTVGPPRSIPGYMSPCKEVKVSRVQGRAYAFEIVDSTGEIAYFSNDALLDDLDLDSRPAGEAIPKETAISIAKSVLGASGLGDETGDPATIERQFTRPPRASAHVWLVSFRRVAGGVPFRTEEVIVLLDAETGAVKGMSKNFISLPSKNRVPLVDAEKAAQVAGAISLDAGIRSAPRQPALQYVQPNTFWSNGRPPAETHLPAELAWIFVYPLENSAETAEVWVSAVTAQVVGGDAVFLQHRKSPTRRGRAWIRDAAQFNRLVGSAQQFRVYSRAGAGRPAGVLDIRHNASLFRSLRTLRISRHRDQIQLHVVGRLAILTPEGEYELGFDRMSGIVLATSYDYGPMPRDVHAWLKTLSPGTR